jgi:hypothetical protein
MRKFFMILTLAVSYLAVSGAASANVPQTPQCDPGCPWVR